MKKLLFINIILFLFLITACEPETTFTINYNSNGGSEIQSDVIDDLSSFTLPDDPVKVGYTFDGWFFDETFEVHYTLSYLTALDGDEITLYAKWVEQLDNFTITFKNGETILETYTVLEGELPLYDGLTPTKDQTATYIYQFAGWSPSIEVATSDQTYQALFNEFDIYDGLYNPTTLNQLFGYAIYDLIPLIESSDYETLNYSTESYQEVYIDLFDWTENDAYDYMDSLDASLPYDDLSEVWTLGPYSLYLYLDSDSYPGSDVYGIAIYGDYVEIDLFDDFALAVDEIELIFSDCLLTNLLPNINDYTDILLTENSSTSVTLNGTFNVATRETILDDWYDALIETGYVLNTDLSTAYGYDVYTFIYSSTTTFAIYAQLGIGTLEINFWSFNPNLNPEITAQMDYMQSINQYEVEAFSQSGLPSSGTYDVLVIPIEIQGYPFASDYVSKLDTLFNGTASETGWQSVSSYYQLSSYGKLNMTFDIHTKYTTLQTKSYYEQRGSDGDQYAIKEALSNLDSQIDFSKYDSNNDGYIDSIYFVYSIDYNYSVDLWWAWVYHAEFGEASNLGLLDGKTFGNYMWASYAFLEDTIPGSDVSINAETFIHETGHLMGAIDMYSYTETYGPMGSMSMMDYNNGDFDPFHKILFGWSRPDIAYASGTYDITLESYALDHDGLGSTIVIPYQSNAFDDGDAFDEFIIIMFYTPEGLYSDHLGLDYVLDHAGVMVYHVDARLYNGTFWDPYFMYNNDGTSDFFAELLEVDGNDSLDYRDILMSDVLTSGAFDLSSYSWHQGGSIDVSIELTSIITDTADAVSFVLTIQ